MNPADFSAIWSAVDKHARDTRRAAPRAVIVLYSDGSLAEVNAIGRSEEVWGDTPGDFPTSDGWSFRAGLVAYKGRTFRLSGLRYRLLRALVDASGAPVRDRVLKARVWCDSTTDDGRLKDVAFGLRATLRAELGIDDGVDPVERLDGGYRLSMQ